MAAIPLKDLIIASTILCISGIDETRRSALNTLNTLKTLKAPEDGASEIIIITKSKLFHPSLKNFEP
jgi:hypothetical protein